MEYEMENRALQSSHVKHIYGHIKINTRKVCATIGYKVLIFLWATAIQYDDELQRTHNGQNKVILVLYL